MSDYPQFPEFKPLALEDRDEVHRRLWAYQPTTSELTFSNLYIWRAYYKFAWCLHEDYLLLTANREGETFALPPVGPPSRAEVTRTLLAWLREEHGVEDAFVGRADQRLVDELAEDGFAVEPTRDHFDYVYLSEDLGTLSGRRYSKKRNHINQFLRQYRYTYTPLTEALAPDCLALAEVWCEQRLCEDDISLMHEFCGIKDALENLDALHLDGGVILIDDKVQAFSLGELLNDEVAVVHIEKANPEFSHIYPLMTNQYSAQRWQDAVKYINREQDVGEPGLRRAKQSYYPDHLEEKFRIRLT